MSLRNFRKVYGGNVLPLPEGDSDEEYAPLYTKCSPSKYKYQGLVLSSRSESEHESTDAVVVEDTTSSEIAKKKKKKTKKQRKVEQVASGSSSKEIPEMDEIDKALMEVRALIGSPPAPSTSTAKVTYVDIRNELMCVQKKHLNAANELRRMFGPEPVDPANRRRGRQANLTRLLKKALIVPLSDNAASFKKFGLSMSVQSREEKPGGFTYFTFDHSREYQRVHRAFLLLNDYSTDDLTTRIELAQKNMHVEGLLECADALFRLEEYTAANKIIEQVISYMQYVAHPFFNLTNRIRLEYKYMENRPFHIAVLKYLHLLTNRACHRTALELAKLLLNLDPSDPLAVLFIVDVLALRSREHQWLIDAVDFWRAERDAGFLFNMQYSYALAHFHVATKSKGDLAHADQLLQQSMINFPAVVLNILKFASALEPWLQSHVLYESIAFRSLSRDLKNLIVLHAKFTESKWREPAVLKWLLKNVKDFVDKLDADPEFMYEVRLCSFEQGHLFKGLPTEMIRYLSAIKPMSDLLVDGAVPRVNRARSCDPQPPADGVDRYVYCPPRNAPGVTSTPLSDLFNSLLPHYSFAAPQGLEPQEVFEQGYQELVQAFLGPRAVGQGLNNLSLDSGTAASPEAGAASSPEAGAASSPEAGAASSPEAGAVASPEAGPAPSPATAFASPEDERVHASAQALGEPSNFVATMAVLTDAVRRFIDLYETGNDPEANTQGNQQPDERQEGQDENRQIDGRPNEDGPNVVSPNVVSTNVDSTNVVSPTVDRTNVVSPTVDRTNVVSPTVDSTNVVSPSVDSTNGNRQDENRQNEE